MKGIIVVQDKILKFITGDFARAMALFPFILVKDKSYAKDKYLMHHERIHLKQQVELFILPFYIWYGFEYLVRRVQFRSHYIAYRHISFEREAYANEKNLNYLRERKFWSFLKYL